MGMASADRVEALKDRIRRDAAEARTWGAVAGLDAVDSDGELANVRLWEPAIDNIARTYLLLGRTYDETGDWSSAIAAYERAIGMADAMVVSSTSAAEIRAEALRGQAAIWRGQKQPLRADAASVLALGEERWLRSGAAAEAADEFRQLMRRSRSAADELTRQRNERAFKQVGQAALMAAAAHEAGAGASPTTVSAIALTTVRIIEIGQSLQRISQGLKDGSLDLGAIASLLDGLPALREATRAKDAALFQRAEVVAEATRMVDALVKLRRGAPAPEWVRQIVESGARVGGADAAVAERVADAVETAADVVAALEDLGDASETVTRILDKLRHGELDAEQRATIQRLVDRLSRGDIDADQFRRFLDKLVPPTEEGP